MIHCNLATEKVVLDLLEVQAVNSYGKAVKSSPQERTDMCKAWKSKCISVAL